MASRTPKEIARGIPHLFIASESDPNDTDTSTKGEEGTSIGDIQTEPMVKVVFNAPFINKYSIRICNNGSRQVGWAIKTNCPARIGIDPPHGVLGPKEKTIFYVTCKQFDHSSTDLSTDRITIVWVLTPERAPQQFKQEWFQGDVTTRRKNVASTTITNKPFLTD